MKLFMVLLLVLFTFFKVESGQLDQLTMMKRTCCLIISRNYVNTLSNKLSMLLRDSSEEDQTSSIWKLHAAMGKMCENNINQSQLQQFYTENEDFDMKAFYYLVSDIDLLSVLSDSTLTEKEREIVQFHQEFDRRHVKEGQEEERDEYLIDEN